MTDQEFVAAVEATGADDVWVMSQPMDCGSKLGVGVSFMRDGRLRRSAVRLAPDAPIEDAYPVLLDWVLDNQK